MIKSRMKMEGYIDHMREIRNAYIILVGSLKRAALGRFGRLEGNIKIHSFSCRLPTGT
jgi:hypothetical protein